MPHKSFVKDYSFFLLVQAWTHLQLFTDPKKKKLFTDTLNPQPIFFLQVVGPTSSNNCAFSYGGFKKIKKTWLLETALFTRRFGVHLVYVFKNWKLLFENICENTCGVKKYIKIRKILFKNWKILFENTLTFGKKKEMNLFLKYSRYRERISENMTV